MVAAAHGRAQVVAGVQPRGGLGQGGQQGRLRQVQAGGGLAEPHPAGRLHPIGPAAEIGAVEIEGEDLVLAQHGLDPQGQGRFLQLAGQGLVRGQEDAPGHLLGDGGAALHHPVRRQVRPGRPGHAHQVHPVVVVEAPVLRRQEGLGHIGGQLGEADGRAVAEAALAQHLAVAVEKGDPRRPVHGPQGLLARDRRQLGKGDAPDPQADQQGGQGPAYGPHHQPPQDGLPPDRPGMGQVRADRSGRRVGGGRIGRPVGHGSRGLWAEDGVNSVAFGAGILYGRLA